MADLRQVSRSESAVVATLGDMTSVRVVGVSLDPWVQLSVIVCEKVVS